ncbi:MAG: hypothetical protein GC155_01850 [Alphaproteobacteria bacterium]|nr:hypothetical protein [Alphaproteobacteria bacterium]
MAADPFLPWLFAVKLGLYAACLAAGGFGLHVASGMIAQDQSRPALRTAAGLGLAALVFAALRIGIVNAQLGDGWSSVLDAGSFHWSWRVLGHSTLAIVAGAAIIALAWIVATPAIAALGAVGLAASFALTGHSEALASPGPAPWAVGVHVLIAAYWATAPFILWPGRNVSDERLVHRLQRFSTLATWAIPILFLLGLWLLWRLAGGVEAIFASGYGRLLLAKFAVALVALAMGALNKLRLTQHIEAGRDGARSALRWTLIVEGAVFIAALVLVDLATTVTGPPDASM